MGQARTDAGGRLRTSGAVTTLAGGERCASGCSNQDNRTRYRERTPLAAAMPASRFHCAFRIPKRAPGRTRRAGLSKGEARRPVLRFRGTAPAHRCRSAGTPAIVAGTSSTLPFPSLVLPIPSILKDGRSVSGSNRLMRAGPGSSLCGITTAGGAGPRPLVDQGRFPAGPPAVAGPRIDVSAFGDPGCVDRSAERENEAA